MTQEQEARLHNLDDLHDLFQQHIDGVNAEDRKKIESSNAAIAAIFEELAQFEQPTLQQQIRLQELRQRDLRRQRFESVQMARLGNDADLAKMDRVQQELHDCGVRLNELLAAAGEEPRYIGNPPNIREPLPQMQYGEHERKIMDEFVNLAPSKQTALMDEMMKRLTEGMPASIESLLTSYR